ncbi:MAG: efflux RND transporter permease subunit [Lachnospiraceae bacterium]|nr:efflux RND transporter permease subunit [Lachnospiraceae bacterium]MDY5498235.1 efflux RND transporter permease subunit [Anaerobutyricum sp.]
MTKYFVKKPYFVVVAVVIVLVIGMVSLGDMQTDLLPELELPYMAVVTTEVGASPEKVEKDVVEPLESTLGTVNGVEKIASTSSNNYGMVMIQFAEDTNMEAALVRVSKATNSIDLPEGCGTPNIMELSADMMATMYASVNYDEKDIKELSTFTKKVVKPYLERQEGVASVSANGLVEDHVEIRLNEEKIDKINDKILGNANEKLIEAGKKISDARASLTESKEKLEEQEGKLSQSQKDTNKKIGDAATQISKAQAQKAAYEAQLNSLEANKSALEAEKKAYKDNKLEDTYTSINTMFGSLNSSMGEFARQAGINIPSSVKDALDHPDDFDAFVTWMKQNGYKDQVANLSLDSLKQVYNAVEVRLPKIDSELSTLENQITVQKAIIKKLNEQMKGMDEKQSQVIAGGYTAAAGFGAGQAQIASGKSQMESAQSNLDDAEKQLDDSKKATQESANINSLLSLDTLSTIISAQNFSMPAGYIDDKEDNQWLVEVGDNFDEIKDLKRLVLTKIDGVGKIRISDVADVTVLSNEGETYSKVNGKDAILLSVYKGSTSNTSEVSEKIQEAFREMEKKYPGLSFTPMMNQGEFINIIIKSVLTSILLGALLAVIVLAFFLKDVRPTVVVAFSIPFSVLFAIIIMYFSGININVMSLAGLCLGIGMLVDNSIVVMENIYRLRNLGISAPRAAVQGTKQVAGPILASTITTICVFLPMVYTSGMVSQLLIPFAFTISYALIASLLVAVTVVPTMGSVLLKKTKVCRQPWFDRQKDRYAKVLALALKHKAVPLLFSVGLFVLCVVWTFSTGIVMLDDMDSNQISVSLTLDDDVKKEDAYETADEVMDIITKVKGIKKVSALDGNATVSMLGTDSTDNYSSFSYNIITDDDVKTTKDFRKIRKEIEKKTKKIKCKEITVASSAMGAMSGVFGGGLSVNVYGDDQQKLIEISNDLVKMMNHLDGVESASNGLENADRMLHLKIDRNKAAEHGLTVAQIYQEIAKRTTTEKNAITIDVDDKDVEVNLVDETDKLTYDNIMNLKIETTEKDSEGKDEKHTYKLSEFATTDNGYSMDSINREDQKQYITVTGELKDTANATLLSRKLQDQIDQYDTPDGYQIEMSGEVTQTSEMVKQMGKALALGFLLIYLVMVAQFQSLLSPFIVIFTVPLAFTGGMIGLKIFGMSISAMSLMGFMILMGTVVNNGIVFVDYVNKLRIRGMDKHSALIQTGKTRMRPILMTAMTTILSMSVMVFSRDAGNAMQKGMAVVVSAGLLYATFMTLFIVPVMYDILYRRQPKEIDVGDDLDQIPDETEEALEIAKNEGEGSHADN